MYSPPARRLYSWLPLWAAQESDESCEARSPGCGPRKKVMNLENLTLPFAVPYCTLLYLIVLYCILLYLTVPYCTLLYLTAPYCTLLYLTVPHSTLRYNKVQ